MQKIRGRIFCSRAFPRENFCRKTYSREEISLKEIEVILAYGRFTVKAYPWNIFCRTLTLTRTETFTKFYDPATLTFVWVAHADIK